MIRGTIAFRCSKCNKTFTAPDAEYCATILSTPMPCPRCGIIRTMPLLAYLNPLNIFAYKGIWEAMDEKLPIAERCQKDKKGETLGCQTKKI